MNGQVWIGVAALAVFTVPSDTSSPNADNQIRLSRDDIAQLPKAGAGTGTSGVSGIRTTILTGNPDTASFYTIMLQVPANTRIAAHTHRDTRSAVVISGTWHFGYGDAADDAKSKALGPQSYYTEPSGVSHFARTGAEPVVLYITGMGPSDTRFVAVRDSQKP